METELHNSGKCGRVQCLALRQPFASDFVRVGSRDADGTEYGVKSVEVRGRNTAYRGDVLLCSTRSPRCPGMESGAMLGLAELYETKPVAEFTPGDWGRTRIPKGKRAEIAKGYGWFFRHPRRVVEMPVGVKAGFHEVPIPDGAITEYPRHLAIDKKGWEYIKGRLDGWQSTAKNKQRNAPDGCERTGLLNTEAQG